MNICASFHDYESAANFVKNHEIKEFTINTSPKTGICLLNYNAEDLEPEVITEAPSDDRRDFIVGALVGYLEDKEQKAAILESIIGEVALYYEDIQWVEVY